MKASANQVIEAPEREDDLAASPAPLKIDPGRVVRQYAGFAYSSFFVRLPKGMIADDLKRSEIWSAVQTANPLKKLDEVKLVSWNEDWIAEAVVSDANRSQVTLAGIRITTLGQRYEALPEDDQYKVAWQGNGYAVIRKGDGHAMSSPVANAALAAADLRALYPVQK